MFRASQSGPGVGHDPLGLEREAVIGRAACQLSCQQRADLPAACPRLPPAGGCGGQSVQGAADVSLDTDLDVVAGINFRGEPAQVQDPLVPARVDPGRVELLQLIAGADDYVRLIESEVNVVMPHEPHRAKGIRVVIGEDPLAVEGGCHRQAQLLGEAPHSARRAGPGGPVAGEHDRLPRAAEHRRSPLDLPCRRLVRPGDVEVERSQPLRHAHGLDVLGHGQIDRAGTFGLRELERLADHLRDRARGQDHVRPLGHRREHRHQIDALVGLLVDPVQADLCRQSHYRRTVRRRICRAQEQVDRARSQGRRAHPGAPSQAAVDLGHERRRLLVAHQHIPDRRAGQGVSETDVLLARDTEHDGDALTLQTAHKQIRNAKLLGHHRSLPPDSSGLAGSVARCWRRGGYLRDPERVRALPNRGGCG